MSSGNFNFCGCFRRKIYILRRFSWRCGVLLVTESQTGNSEFDDSASLSGQHDRTTSSYLQQRDSAVVDRGRLSSPIPVGLLQTFFLLNCVERRLLQSFSVRTTPRQLPPPTTLHLKIKSPGIYIPPLTGKPEQQRFTNWSGVLTKWSALAVGSAAQLAAAHCTNRLCTRSLHSAAR